MEISEKRKENGVVVAIKGRLDAVSSTEVKTHLIKTVEQTSGVLALNLADLDYISSMGLQVVLAVAKKLKTKQRDLVLVSPHGMVRQIFELSGFVGIFRIVDSEEAAFTDV